ncbi:MAG: YicC family protein [Desulfatitalea sp.]|nr:YicC family protein [Desulfatitalea sp.]MBI5896946.1 YicC family protein [Desulfobacterales bacterium]
MLKSMTAYASEEKNDQTLTVGVEMRAYNSRHLDIALRLSSGYASLEEKIKAQIAARVVRGRVEVRIGVKDASEKASAFEVDAVKARAFCHAASTLKSELKLSGDLTLEHLLGLPGVIQSAENLLAADLHWPLMADCLTKVLENLDRMRRREGEHLRADFVQRLDWIEAQLKVIEASTDGLLAQYRDRLQARIEALTQGVVTLDPMRIAQEAALMADRSDISEEIVRAKSHIAQFRSVLDGDEPAGRKLNFLLQEFNREFNTMGSKTGHAAVSHTIVAVKAELEKMREQVQNIE